MDGISESGVEEQYIVECASSVISITNPDRSTALFDQVLMSWNWEEKDAVRRHFETIRQLLSA